jgi:hypothetical protein
VKRTDQILELRTELGPLHSGLGSGYCFRIGIGYIHQFFQPTFSPDVSIGDRVLLGVKYWALLGIRERTLHEVRVWVLLGNGTGVWVGGDCWRVRIGGQVNSAHQGIECISLSSFDIQKDRRYNGRRSSYVARTKHFSRRSQFQVLIRYQNEQTTIC